MKKKFFLCFLTHLISTSAVTAGTPTSFDALVDQYLADYFSYFPTQATALGIHDFDEKLEGYSSHQVKNAVATLKKYKRAFEKFPKNQLSRLQAIDREMVVLKIQSVLLDLEEIRYWKTNPDFYTSTLNYGIYLLISQKFASLEERLRPILEREKASLTLLLNAKKNLNNPPRIYTEIALEQLPGVIDFFSHDLPLALTELKDPSLLSQFNEINGKLVLALQDYLKFLKDDLLPRSQGSFRLGSQVFSKKLHFDEMVTTSLAELLKIGQKNLQENQNRFLQISKSLYPGLSNEQILDKLNLNTPTPDKLLATVRKSVADTKEFVKEHHIVTLPQDTNPSIEETPSFQRALYFASMNAPGPFEKNSHEAFYYVTLPEKNWDEAHIKDHMAAFNFGTVTTTSIHEVFPGHYTQFLWFPQAPTKLRKVLQVNSNIEGWAHYTEQMLLDEGYGKGDSLLRLNQLQDALLRNGRFIVGIQMHTGKMSFEEGVDFFVKECFLTKSNAERETKRGTVDPTYLYYTLGKIMILDLREEYKKKKGKDFRLEDFHNRFLAEGPAPLPIIQRVMMEETPTNEARHAK